jgi:sec-independent protein translocase protein TatA
MPDDHNPDGRDTVGLDNPVHIALIALLVLLVFGAKRLPEIGRSLGAGMRGFRQSIAGETDAGDEPAGLPATPVLPTSADGVPARRQG